MSSQSVIRSLEPWKEILQEAGFSPVDGVYHKDNCRFELTGKSLRLVDTAASPPPTPLRGGVDDPGLWKWVRDGQQLRRVFEVPLALIQAEPSTEGIELEDRLSPRELLAWAMATVPPPFPVWADVHETSWLEAMELPDLTVQRASLVRQGRRILEGGRIALEFPLVLELPRELPAGRWTWLEALLMHAQGHWHFVRFGVTAGSGGQESVLGRVDLTGAPPAPSLVLASLEALKQGVAWLVESAELLADMRIASQVVAVLPTDPNQERNDRHESIVA